MKQSKKEWSLGFTESECILHNDMLGCRFYTDRENESEAVNILNQINEWDALEDKNDKLESENKKLRAEIEDLKLELKDCEQQQE